MAEDNANNMTWFERHVVDSLTRLEANQNSHLEEFRVHIASDAAAFEIIRTELATSKASHEATSKSTSRFWAAIATGVSLIASTLVHFLAHK